MPLVYGSYTTNAPGHSFSLLIVIVNVAVDSILCLLTYSRNSDSLHVAHQQNL